MIYQIYLLCLPVLLGEALQISSMRPYLGKERKLHEGNYTEDVSQFMFDKPNETQTFSSGFVRTDTFDWLQSKWIQAQVLPIGVCFKEGSRGGSAQIAQITMDSASVLRVTNLYSTIDCSGDFSSVPFMLPISETSSQFEYVIKHVQDIDTALEINPPYADGLIATSYYSSEGCTGEPAQYDLVSTDCIVYDYPIAAYGTFECDKEAEMMVVTLYGPYDGEAYTYLSCQPFTGFDDAIPEFEYGDEYGYGYGYGRYKDTDIIKQPFQCTDESAIGGELENFPYYQTVRCVAGKSFPGEESSYTDSSVMTESSELTESFSMDSGDFFESSSTEDDAGLSELSTESENPLKGENPQEDLFYAAVQTYKAARLMAGETDDYDFEPGSEAEGLFHTALQMFRAARGGEDSVEEDWSTSSYSYGEDDYIG